MIISKHIIAPLFSNLISHTSKPILYCKMVMYTSKLLLSQFGKLKCMFPRHPCSDYTHIRLKICADNVTSQSNELYGIVNMHLLSNLLALLTLLKEKRKILKIIRSSTNYLIFVNHMHSNSVLKMKH